MKKNLPKPRNTKAIVEYQSGPVRIKDGLFMGDQAAARDMDFLISNKVTHIINTVVKKVPNLFEKYGIYYLSVHWTEKQKNIFDKKNQALTQIYNFIQQAEQQGQCVLVHSINGKSRASTVIIAYLMKKYSWSLKKAQEYVQAKKDNLQIRENFRSELINLQSRLKEEQKLSQNWQETKDNQDITMTNTHKNMKIKIIQKQVNKKTKKHIKWSQKLVNQVSHHKEKVPLTSYSKYVQLYESPKKSKGILKGQNNQSQQQFTQKDYQDNIPEEYRRQQGEKISDIQERLSKSQVIGRINGNIVNVTVNNYITTEEPRIKSNLSMKNAARYNSVQERQSRQSSTQKKNLQKKSQNKSGSRLMPYQNIISSFRSPYDSNFMEKVGMNSRQKKKEEHELRNYNNSIPVHDRPQSIGSKDTKKPKTYAQLLAASSAKRNAQIGLYRERVLRYK